MRVLHLYAGNLFGGIETMLITLAKYRGLCPGMEPSFGYCFDGKFSESLKGLQVPVYKLGEVRARFPWTVYWARRKLARLLEEGRFDVVVTHACWPHAMFGQTVLKKNIPLVFYCHDILNGRHWLEKSAGKIKPTSVIANSQHTGDSLKRVFPSVPYSVVYYPVELPQRSRLSDGKRAEFRKQLGIDERQIVIIQVSRMEEWKGHQLLIHALAKLKSNVKWSCLIVGGPQRPHEGRYFDGLQRLADNSGLGGRVQFLGQRSDVQDLLRASDVFCQPNTSPEPFGIVFIEALGADLPVVTTPIGGGKEIVDATCGILTGAFSPDQLADQLKVLIEDDGLRYRLSQGSLARAQGLCDPQQQLNKLYALMKGPFNDDQ